MRPWIYELPPVPQVIIGAPYKIEYISLLAQAQRMTGIRAIDDSANFAGAVAQMNPDILDVYDFDEMARERADLVGLPARLIRSEDKVLTIRKAKQAAAQEAQDMEMAERAAAGAKTLGDAKLNPEDPSVLSEMLKGLGGEAMQ